MDGGSMLSVDTSYFCPPPVCNKAISSSFELPSKERTHTKPKKSKRRKKSIVIKSFNILKCWN